MDGEGRTTSPTAEEKRRRSGRWARAEISRLKDSVEQLTAENMALQEQIRSLLESR